MTAVFNTHRSSEETKTETLMRIEQRLSSIGREDLFPLAEAMAEGPVALEVMRKAGIDSSLTELLIQRLNLAGAESKDDWHEADQRLLSSPAARARMERYQICQKALQQLLNDRRLPADLTLASIPCGYMREVLTLDYSDYSPRFIGIDKDPQALSGARQLARKLGFSQVDLYLKDARVLGPLESVDIVVGNGLNMYLDDDDVAELYEQYHGSLNPGGYCITSHLTPSKTWRGISAEDLQFQDDFYSTIVGGRWISFMRTAEQTCAQLTRAGFEVQELLEDSLGACPTFIARRD